jgi:hypothetical protein
MFTGVQLAINLDGHDHLFANQPACCGESETGRAWQTVALEPGIGINSRRGVHNWFGYNTASRC